jgi:hypothetical protein
MKKGGAFIFRVKQFFGLLDSKDVFTAKLRNVGSYFTFCENLKSHDNLSKPSFVPRKEGNMAKC